MFFLKSALYKCAGICTCNPRKYIPKFTKEFVGAPKGTCCGFWWPHLRGLKAKEIRLDALQTLFYYYTAHDELILKGKEL